MKYEEYIPQDLYDTNLIKGLAHGIRDEIDAFILDELTREAQRLEGYGMNKYFHSDTCFNADCECNCGGHWEP